MYAELDVDIDGYEDPCIRHEMSGIAKEKPPPGAESRLIDFEELINSLVGVADLNRSLGVADRCA